MIQYSSVNYKNWTNINVNSSWIRSKVFKYRLIDLQYVVNGIL
jgi:hypothetical protein